jgi:hypothetical protein
MTFSAKISADMGPRFNVESPINTRAPASIISGVISTLRLSSAPGFDALLSRIPFDLTDFRGATMPQSFKSR